MLILDRRKDEVIVMTVNGIEIKITNCGNRTAHLGIDAPPEVKVVREELLNPSGNESG